MATLLDPRFKVKGFSSATFVEMAKSKVLEKAKEMVKSSETTGSVEKQECREVASSSKKKQSTLWEVFEKDDLDCPITLSQGERELKQYLGISRLPHSADPVKFRRSHGTHFPQLALLSRRVLAIPPTSADSERVFSCAGNMVTPTRSCWDPKKVEMLVFFLTRTESTCKRYSSVSILQVLHMCVRDFGLNDF